MFQGIYIHSGGVSFLELLPSYHDLVSKDELKRNNQIGDLSIGNPLFFA